MSEGNQELELYHQKAEGGGNEVALRLNLEALKIQGDRNVLAGCVQNAIKETLALEKPSAANLMEALKKVYEAYGPQDVADQQQLIFFQEQVAEQLAGSLNAFASRDIYSELITAFKENRKDKWRFFFNTISEVLSERRKAKNESGQQSQQDLADDSELDVAMLNSDLPANLLIGNEITQAENQEQGLELSSLSQEQLDILESHPDIIDGKDILWEGYMPDMLDKSDLDPNSQEDLALIRDAFEKEWKVRRRKIIEQKIKPKNWQEFLS